MPLFFSLFTLGLLAGVWSAPHPKTPRITGGTSVDATQVPYMAAIEFFGRFSCPGAIISPRWIVSSAICMDLLDAESIVVRTGATEYETGGRLYPVETIVRHPNYGPTDNYAADLALVQLGVDLVLNDATKAVSIADLEPAAGTAATVSGWGAVAEGSIMHRGLLSVTLPIYDRAQCDTHFSFNITTARICTLKTGAGPCEYDEGDPLVVGGRLAGIKSWVLQEQCGISDRPSLYVNLANPLFRDFIKANAGV